MSDAEEFVYRAPLQPVGFSVQCPACDHEVDVDHVGQRDSGAWSVWASGHPEAGHVQCDFCGAIIEPTDIEVRTLALEEASRHE